MAAATTLWYLINSVAWFFAGVGVAHLWREVRSRARSHR